MRTASAITDRLVSYADKNGYTSCVFENVRDPGRANPIQTPQTDVVMIGEGKTASMDPVTYDNNDRMITSEERFRDDYTGTEKWKSDDKRFSTRNNGNKKTSKFPVTSPLSQGQSNNFGTVGSTRNGRGGVAASLGLNSILNVSNQKVNGILERLSNISKEIADGSERPGRIVGALIRGNIYVRAEDNAASAYADLTEFGRTLRLSDHHANSDNFKTGDNISVVVAQSGKIEGNFHDDSNVNCTEVVFRKSYLNDNKDVAQRLIHDIAVFVDAGEYHDTAGGYEIDISGSEEYKSKMSKSIANDHREAYLSSLSDGALARRENMIDSLKRIYRRNAGMSSEVLDFLITRQDSMFDYETGKNIPYNTERQRYIHDREFYMQYQSGTASKDDYFRNTIAVFMELEKRPNGSPDYVAYAKDGTVSSEYRYTKKGVIRGSNHWGSHIRSCSWYLKEPGSNVENKVYSEERYGYCKWTKFIYRTGVNYANGVATLTSFDNPGSTKQFSVRTDKDAKRIKIETDKPVQSSVRQSKSIQQRTMDAVHALVESKKLAEEEARKYEIVGTTVQKLCDIINNEYVGKLDKNGMPLLPEEGKLSNNIFSNSSYYKDAEPTTECYRQATYRALYKLVTDRLGRPLTNKEQMIVNQAGVEIGVDAPCIYCYSLLDRKAKEAYKLQYVAERDGFMQAIDNDFGGNKEAFHEQRAQVFDKYYQLYLSHITDPSAYVDGEYDKSKARKGNDAKKARVNLWMDLYEKYYGTDAGLLSLEQIRNVEAEGDTREQLEQQYNGEDLKLKTAELDDLQYWIQSSSQAKKIVPYSAYTNAGKSSILQWSKAVINALNAEYGLRWYSHADFHPAFTIDNIQQITDASVRGLKGLMYVKPIEAAKIFAPTGMNINVSCFGKYVNGEYVCDDRMGADWEQVKALRNQ